MPETASNLLTAAELSAKLGNRPTAKTLMIHARKGWIPSLLVGRNRRFDWEKVAAKMEEDAKPK